MTRVLLLSPLPPPTGGIARWTQIVIERTVRSEEISLSVLDTRLKFRAPQDLRLSRRLLAGVMHAGSVLWRLLFRILLRRPDVMHVNVAGSLGIVRDALIGEIAWLTRIPLIVHFRFGRIPNLLEEGGWEGRCARRLVHRSARVIAIDALTETALKTIAPSKILRIPNCVELRDRWSEDIPKRQGQYVFVGWITKEKGIEDLLAAWSLAALEGETLLLIGKADEAYLETLDKVGLLRTPGVRLLGELDHEAAMSLVQESTALFLPSYTEGFPNVVVEAMSVATHVVATPVGAIPEMLEGGAGTLVAVGDVRGLASVFCQLSADPLLAHSTGLVAQQRAASEFAAEVVIPRYWRLWSQP